MAVDTASDILAFKKQGTGNNLNTWGDELNHALDRISEAIADRTEKSLTGNYTLTSTNYVANESRSAVLVFSDGGLSSTPTVTIPGRKKLYWAKNTGSTYGITLEVSGGTSVTVPTGGRWVFVFCDGTDCEIHDPSVSDLKAPTTALSMNSQKITSLADPTSAQDAATKNYIDTLAASSDLGTVAGIASEIKTVAANDSNITAVAADAADIGDVATNIANVNSVAGISANVTTVAGISANVTTVAGDSTDVQALAAISADITTVAGISTDVTAVAADASDIGTVSTNIANVNSVAGNSANINAVAGNSTNINAVAADASDIGDVATNIASVNTCATNIEDLQDAASLVTYASKAEAEAGTSETVMMNPLRTKQAIDALGAAGLTFISSQTVSSAVSSVEFTNIASGFSKIIVIAENIVSAEAVSFDDLHLEVGVTSGPTWYSTSGDYYSGAAAETRLAEARIPGASSTYQYGVAVFEVYGLTSANATIGVFPYFTYATASNSISTFAASGSWAGGRSVAQAEDAIRFVTNGGHNITSGTFYLYGASA